MRIVAGRLKGRRIAAPEGSDIRPTSDRARESLFNILAHNPRLGADGDGAPIRDAIVLDAFAGCGALGLEALSRGAATCLFVENEPAAIRALRTNIAALRAQPQCDVRAGSVMQLGPAKAPLDLILLDPPYHSGAGGVALDRLHRLGWIGAGSWVALETAHDEKVQVKALETETERKVGKALLTLLRAP
jgi:16S rRNA (guanine966-N2)-methyltransferase